VGQGSDPDPAGSLQHYPAGFKGPPERRREGKRSEGMERGREERGSGEDKGGREVGTGPSIPIG